MSVIVKNTLTPALKRLTRHELNDKFGKRISREALRLSRNEVPIKDHDLKTSGIADKDKEGWYTAYNIEYATYQHEGMRVDGSRVVKNYTTPGRKSKYLEDPIKTNYSKWRKIAKNSLEYEIKRVK